MIVTYNISTARVCQNFQIKNPIKKASQLREAFHSAFNLLDVYCRRP